MQVPNLKEYDWIVINSSAGKDSQAMLDYVMELAEAAGVARCVVVVHCNLGRVEWPGTRELAWNQSLRYGVRFDVVCREQGDLLNQVEARGMWPSPKQRYCTSDQKRAPVHRLYTALAAETGRGRQARILSCQGMRAEESPARSKRAPFEQDERASNGRRRVDNWLPIHSWKVADVWARIKAGRTADLIHPAYGLGMPRLSCCFCIFAPKSALVLAGKHNRELLAEYVRIEEKIGHKFRVDLSLAEVQAAVEANEATSVADWKM
jgi:3'-phosphoadenosine 5'-phosphosulfate sulfotransferase (PAPS reductase)/FAD synthetase